MFCRANSNVIHLHEWCASKHLNVKVFHDVEAAVRMAFASYAVWSSSRRDGKAWEISDLMEARVRERNSVPYRCLTSLRSSGLINRSQVSTTKFSREGEISSSSVTRSPW